MADMGCFSPRCWVSRSRDWGACRNYAPIDAENKVCAYSGCQNYCVYGGVRRKEVPRRKRKAETR